MAPPDPHLLQRRTRAVPLRDMNTIVATAGAAFAPVAQLYLLQAPQMQDRET
jgi:hypothetical protein